jgi:phosphoribosylformylglycinamidine cyclo-ligase
MVTCGAEPLFFLDYFAASKLEPKSTAKIVKGIAKACKKSNCALLGGETAEMPGHYAKNNFDLAGFSVGVVEKDDLIDGQGIEPGHILLGVESSGPHSNGYSLIRSILKKHKAPDSIMQALLKPTHLYPASVLELIKKTNVKGMAHITGGGLTENIPRILKSGLIANVNLSSWKLPKAFMWLQEKGKISDLDMLRIFNCGIGMVCILDKAEILKAKKILSAHKLRTFEIGSVIKGNLQEQIQYN